MTMKAVVITTCRLKSILPGGEVVKTLTTDEYFWGTPNATNTDLTGITYYYTSAGVRVELPKECKASIGAWIKTYLEDEPGENPTEILRAPDQMQARWEIGKDTSGNPVYTEYFTYDLRK